MVYGEGCSLHGDWQDCSEVSFPSIFTQMKDQSTNGNSVRWSHKRKMTLDSFCITKAQIKY